MRKIVELHPFEQKLVVAWPPEAWQDVTVLVAVSGGADSVALLRSLAALKTGGEGRLAVAHLNHQLRPVESAADEALVVELCVTLGIACEVGRSDIRAVQEGGEGLEAAARRVRYEFLEQTASRLGARYVVTAHTSDDQAETILHRILRGTGVRGLSGMARARPLGPATLLRPLLGFRRSEVVAYLADLGQPYRNDSSNQDLRFTRNRLRHDLLPKLAEQYNPELVEALLRLGSLAGEAQSVIDALVEDLFMRSVSPAGPDGVIIAIRPLVRQPRYLVRELFSLVWRRRGWPMQAMGFQEWDLLAEMASPNEPRKQMFPGGVLVEAADGEVRVIRPE